MGRRFWLAGFFLIAAPVLMAGTKPAFILYDVEVDIPPADKIDGRVLTYDTTTGKFKLEAISGIGDVTADDTSTTAQNIVAYNTAGGKNITELTGTQGDILYHNGTIWAKLAVGANGRLLEANGAGTNPTWTAIAGDVSGAVDATTVTDLTITGEVQGNVIFFNGTNWVRLANGTSGQVLHTNGAGANPTWDTDDGAGGTFSGDVGQDTSQFFLDNSTANDHTGKETGAVVVKDTQGLSLYPNSATYGATLTAVPEGRIDIDASSGYFAFLDAIDVTGNVSSTSNVTATAAVGGAGVYQTSAGSFVGAINLTGQARGDVIRRDAEGWKRLALGANNTVLASDGTDVLFRALLGGDVGGSFGALTVTDLTITGEVQGNILYFNGSNWVRLANGTSGQVLHTNGAGANPTWDTDDGASFTGDVGEATTQFFLDNSTASDHTGKESGVVLVSDNQGLTVENESSSMGMTITHSKFDASSGFIEFADAIGVTGNVSMTGQVANPSGTLPVEVDDLDGFSVRNGSDVEFFKVDPDAANHVAVVTAGTLGSTLNALRITGTLPNTAADQRGVEFIIATVAGSNPAPARGAVVDLTANATPGTSQGLKVFNRVAGTNTAGIIGNGQNDGISVSCIGSTAGHNNGITSFASESTASNIGIASFAGHYGVGGTQDIGGMFSADSQAGTGIGVIAQIQAADTPTAPPSLVETALLVDNRDVAASIIVARDNGTEQFELQDGGLAQFSPGGTETLLVNTTQITATIPASAAGIAGSMVCRLHSSTQGTTIANSTTETDLSATITPSLAANSLRAGRHLEGTAWGRYNSAASPGTITIRVYKGTTLLLALPAATPAGTQTAAGWRLEWEMEIETAGASGSAHLVGELSIHGQAAETVGIVNAIINTTSAEALKVTADWSAAQAGDDWICTGALVKYDN